MNPYKDPYEYVVKLIKIGRIKRWSHCAFT